LEILAMNAPIEFETQRLLLRQWRAADREPFGALNADPIVMAHFPAPLTREESDAIADRCERLIVDRRWGAWATENKATGEFIGLVGLLPLNILASRTGTYFERTAITV
jgi:RimJ/RimL family protein N-acetyltransferase